LRRAAQKLDPTRESELPSLTFAIPRLQAVNRLRQATLETKNGPRGYVEVAGKSQKNLRLLVTANHPTFESEVCRVEHVDSTALACAHGYKYVRKAIKRRER